MQIIFSGKHVEVTPAFREYAESKLSKLGRFFDHVQEVHVVQSILRNQHTVEVTLKADGTIIRAEERSPDMYSSIDLVTDKLERQLARYKDRFITRTRESLQGLKPGEVNPADDAEAAAAGAATRATRSSCAPSALPSNRWIPKRRPRRWNSSGMTSMCSAMRAVKKST